MNLNRKSDWKTWRSLIGTLLLAAVLFVPAAGGASEGAASQEELVPLVSITLDGAPQLEQLRALGPTVYLQHPLPGGEILVLLPADAALQDELENLGYTLQILDPDTREASYFLIQGEADALERAQAHATILLRLDDQAVVRMEPADSAQIALLGLRLRLLATHPLETPGEPESTLAAEAIDADPLIQRMVDQVSSDALYQYVGDLSGEWPVTVRDMPYQFYTRYTLVEQPITRATRFTWEYFSSRGILADYYYYSFSGLERRNVLAQQTGLTQPDRYFLLISHLDSISQSPTTSAPGADDNASGSAAVMHIAEILSKYPFGCSLRYVHFTGEEQGLYGSWAYAQYLASQDLDIVAVLNLDMIAYSPPAGTPEIELHTRTSNQTDLQVAGLFRDAVSAYQLDLVPVILNDGLSFSDHYPFWQYGFPGILAIEDWAHHTPYYHTTNDRLSTLNLDYYTEFTKAALATYAHMGCLLQGELQGVISQTSTGTPIPGAVVTIQPADDEPWTTVTGADGSYQLPLYIGDYSVSVRAAGYLSAVQVPAEIVNETTTTLNLALSTPSDFVYLPLIALDAH